MIERIKIDHGLVEKSNAEFSDFMANFKEIEAEYDDQENRRGRLRWLLRMLKKHIRKSLAVTNGLD